MLDIDRIRTLAIAHAKGDCTSVTDAHTVLALCNEIALLRQERDQFREDGRKLVATLERISIALNEAGYPSSPFGVEDRAVSAIKTLGGRKAT